MNRAAEVVSAKKRVTRPGRIENSVPDRLLFFDTVRNVAMLSVVLYHAVAAYSATTPHWSVHDGTSVFADSIRHLFDVFIMPAFFFVAGYFALPSLTRQGVWGFLKGKAGRIGIPWLVAVIVVVPMVRYLGETKAAVGPVFPFRQFWTGYMAAFGTLRVGPASAEIMSQMHFWFLSLLLAFFIILAFSYGILNRRSGVSRGLDSPGSASPKSARGTVVCVGVAASLGYFIMSRLMPEASWINIDLLLQFQPASLVLYGASFMLGLLACSGRWFAGDAFPGRALLWAPVTALLTVGFFVVGHDVFIRPVTSNHLSSGLLLSFSFIRTFLCLSLLELIVAYARTHQNRVSSMNRRLAANSYNIYLCHLFFVVFLQDVLMIWRGGPAMAKAAVVFLVVLPISYGVSRVMDRFPRSFTVGLVAVFMLLICL